MVRAAREIDGDDVLRTLELPLLVTQGRVDTVVLPVLVGWSYGSFVICDYVRAHGQADHPSNLGFRACGLWDRRAAPTITP